MIPDPTPPEEKHYKKRISILPESLPGEGPTFHDKVLNGGIPPKEFATKEGPFDGDSALGVTDPRS